MINFVNRNLSQITDWFTKKGIKQKINIIYIILIIGQLFILTYASNYISTKAIISNTIKQSDESSRLVMTNIENILDNTESYANDLTVRINNYFIDDAGYKGNDYYSNMIFKKIFRNTLYVYPRIYSALLVVNNNTSYVSDNVTKKIIGKNIINDYNMQKKTEGEGSIWMGMRKNEFSDDKSNPYVLTLSKGIVNIDSGDYIGLLCVVTSENTFANIFKNMGMGKSGKYFICDKNGVVVSSTNTKEILKPIKGDTLKSWVLNHTERSQIINLNGVKTLITSFSYSKLNWQLIGTVPLYEITSESRKISFIIITIGIICMLSAVILSSKLSSSITKPLNKFINEIRQIELHNLDVPIQISSDKEIGLLIKNFNNLKLRISELMANILIQQDKQKKYELKLLQSQIKPHFLYNTLQLIYSMIEMDRKDEAQQATKALGDFYRIALSSGNEIISIEQEIKNVESYLYIQKIRYCDAFKFSIDIQIELKKYKILKLTLQPIVENCIKHGFSIKNNNIQSHISISADIQNDILIFEIEDNGCGMKPEKVQHLFDRDLSLNNESFGLKNIDDRIKLFYGYDYGLKVRSQFMENTIVTVIIPALEELNDNFI
jgi:two-component system, sensor histidine kinase YesM